MGSNPSRGWCSCPQFLKVKHSSRPSCARKKQALSYAKGILRRGDALLRELGLSPLYYIVSGCMALLIGFPVSPLQAQDNSGIGPLASRNPFPAALLFLDYTPENPLALPSGRLRVRYQLSVTNTFINTQSPISYFSTPSTEISTRIVRQGISEQNFSSKGYGLYVDMESYLHQLRLDYGLPYRLEASLEMSWVGFERGFLDQPIERVERVFGQLNPHRKYSPRNRMDYYVSRNGVLLAGTSETFTAEMLDPVFHLKWTATPGGDLLPAIALKFSYKYPIKSDPKGRAALVNSGKADIGYAILFSKALRNLVGHAQFARSLLGNTQGGYYAETLRHRLFGLEFRLLPSFSLIGQSITRSSVFAVPGHSPSGKEGLLQFYLSRPTEVLVFGFKWRTERIELELGVLEDYRNYLNEIDISAYTEISWRW